MNDSILEIWKVSKSFGFPVLDSISIRVNPKERFGLIGPNGSGKTTLINIISGVLPCDGGRVIYRGQDITKMPAHGRARLGLARTFQIPKPFASISILDNLKVPLKYTTKGGSEGETEAEALQILQLLELDTKSAALPADLSQVELRRLELARTLALKPKVLILDEVMAGLSTSEVDQILKVLRELNDMGIAIIMIEHILRAVLTFCERLAVLNGTRKIAEGSPEEILQNKEVERAYLGE